MNNLAIITARKNSKRLPNKNTLSLNGKPVISYSIEQALDSKKFKDIFVVSNDEKVLDVASKYKEVINIKKIPDHICDSKTSATFVCIYLYEQLKGIYDTICLLQPTSPLKINSDIVETYNVIENNDFDFAVSATSLEAHYFNFALKEGFKGYELFFGNKYLKDSSLLTKVFRPNGAIKIAKTKFLLEYGHFFGPKLGIHVMPEERSIHIATKFDFEICEFLAKKNEHLYNYSSPNDVNKV